MSIKKGQPNPQYTGECKEKVHDENPVLHILKESKLIPNPKKKKKEERD